ncbi:cryptochrome/photolyase family protein [Aquipuribacter hungaricus]|uniref:Cryptochrome/photolyase family protein n=1 Tax=Aquipuribacter hungaricus TaxID=545624 RepID=A0ABV7WCP2_9MICO
MPDPALSDAPDVPDLVALDLPERDEGTVRWCFADQLGPSFVDDPDGQVLLLETTSVFRRRVFHRRKAHLVLSALRHRAAELGDRVRYVKAGGYVDGLAAAGVSPEDPVSVCDPTSWAARRFVRRLVSGEVGPGAGSVRLVAARGYASSHADFAAWATGREQRRLLQDDWYRTQRVRHGILVEGDGQPVGGRWSFDEENRESPPRGATTLSDAVMSAPMTPMPEPWWPEEDDIDAGVREDLDHMEREGVRFVGEDGPRRFAVTAAEATTALAHFLEHRLDAFGPYEDAMLAGDRWMAHSLLSASINLGVLDPVDVARAAADRVQHGARLASVEGFVRQVIGWRDYVWQLYWHQGEGYRERDALQAGRPLPAWFADLDADRTVTARCLSDVLGSVREEGWAHHIPRLMVLGNWGLQHGYDPQALTDWFHRSFVDGYEWVMVPNVVGMSQHADGGVMATKPYASGGAYIDRMSDYCKPCRYDPKVRVGETACPFTAGYWAFVARHADLLGSNPRTSRAVAGLRRLGDREALLRQELDRGDAAP